MKRALRTNPKEPQAVDRYVGERIRQRRNELGISQGALGEALGVTFQQIQKYERGTNRISAGRLFGLANLFEVQLSYFFEGLPTGGSKRRKRA